MLLYYINKKDWTRKGEYNKDSINGILNKGLRELWIVPAVFFLLNNVGEKRIKGYILFLELD